MGLLLRTTMLVLAVACTTAPPPTLSVTEKARGIQPGELVILTITSDQPLSALRVQAFDHDWPVTRESSAPDGTESWRSLVGIDLDVPVGPHDATITATSAGGETPLVHPLNVVAKQYRTRRLTVDPNFVNPPAAELPRIREESARQNAIWSSAPTTPPEPLTFRVPVPHQANSAFGTRSIFNGEPRGAHTGADFLSPAGTPIKAPAAGTVRLVGNLYYSGGSVIVDHGLGIYSLFAQMSKFDVSEGQTVAAGDVLGRVGATGRVTGAHLHWTVRMGQARVDPLSLVELLPAPTTSR